MTTLFLASLAFLLTHLGVSSTPLRGVLVKTIGQNGYLGLYTVLSFFMIGWMIWAWNQIDQTPFIWTPGLAATAIARAIMPFAFILVVGGVMTKNPTAVGQDAAINEEIPGFLKITRHPVQWGILLWAIAHIIGNGDQASIIFFGTFALLSGFGTVAIDAKRKALEDPAWEAFYATTSNIPLAALLGGRTRLAMSEVNWLAVGIALVLFVVVYIFHEWVSGVALY